MRMRIRKIAGILLLSAGIFLFSGCGGEKQKIYEQAEIDLENGSYQQALENFEASILNEVKLPYSYRGAAVANLKMGNYEAAIDYFTQALSHPKTGKVLKKDILSYRATAELKLGQYDNAMLDCQAIAQEYEMDADTYFLTGAVALEMDGYGEAETNFEKSYERDSTYERAIQIYQIYVDKDMEADGTGYLETALQMPAKSAQEYCERGRVYFYMEDYNNAISELNTAVEKGNVEALAFLGMVYFEQGDITSARDAYQRYIAGTENNSKGYNGLAVCDIEEGDYSSALSNIQAGLPMASIDELESLLYNEIVVYEKQLDFETALVKAKEYLELYPGDPDIEKEVIFLESRI